VCVGADDQQPILPVILVLDVPQGVLPCVEDVRIGDIVSMSRVPDLHSVKVTLTRKTCKGNLDIRLGHARVRGGEGTPHGSDSFQ
jgi:hypothetical protein